MLATLNEEASIRQAQSTVKRPRPRCEALDGDTPLVGYMLSYEGLSGSLFAGVTAEEIAETVCFEIQAQQDDPMDAGVMRLSPITVTCNEINNMPKHEGW